MLTPQQVAEFNEKGFLMVDGVFETPQMDALRKELMHFFQNSHHAKAHPRDKEFIKYDLAHRFPTVKWLLFHWPIVTLLKALAGDSYFTPLTNLCAQKSYYSTWHRDTDYWELIGHYHHYKPHFLMINVGLYLQDNHPEYGGGLDVIPGSHKTLERATSIPMEQPSDDYLEAHPPFTIPARKGSVIFFDQRLRHKATTPTVELEKIPIEKMAIFWTVTPADEHLSAYYELIENLYGYQVTAPVIMA